MPMGRGVRWQVRCPECGEWRRALYRIVGSPLSARCRICLELRYRSQYQGRRPEASIERLYELDRVSLRAERRSPEAAQRRALRSAQAWRTYQQREADYVARLFADLARFGSWLRDQELPEHVVQSFTEQSSAVSFG
jgi:hypothetical protein